MAEPTSRLKHLLRRYGAIVRERSLRNSLDALSAAFDRWKSGKLRNGELTARISEFQKASEGAAAHHDHAAHAPRDPKRPRKHDRA